MRLLGIEKIAETKFLTFLKRKYLSGGEEKEWIYATRRNSCGTKLSKKNNAVVIMGVTKGGYAVLIKEPRIPLSEPDSDKVIYELGLPAGLIDEGETAEEAAKREMLEETGYRIIEIMSSSPLLASSPGLTDECSTIIVCAVEKTDKLPEEEIEVVLARSLNDIEITDDMVWGAKAYLCMNILGLANVMEEWM